MTRVVTYLREYIWGHLPAQVTRRQRRWAAVLWGGLLVIWGGWLFWERSRRAMAPGMAPWLTGAVGVVLGGLLWTAAVGPGLYLAVLRIMSVFGFLISHLLLILFFYLFVTPMGWILRVAGNDFLSLHRKPEWSAHRPHADRRRYYRLF